MFKNFIHSQDSFIIAEVGQNHQGNLDNAIEYIKTFSRLGADSIKFQTRNNKYLFAEEAYNKAYNSENAFAKTYGAHREALELEIKWLDIIAKTCKDEGVYFMSTPFDEPSLEVLVDKGVEIIKIASFDLGNLPFIKRIADTKIPVVMSIGGGKIEQISSSIEILLNQNCDLAVLHCVSEYPCEFDRLGLENISILKEQFPECAIGSSDHFNGTLSGPIAYMKGARVFEKHVTLNRAWKGTDHSFALEPDGFRKFVRDIRRVPQMMPQKDKNDLGKEFVFQKLGKSIIAKTDLNEGDVLTLENLSGKIFNNIYIPVRESNTLIGKKLKRPIKASHFITLDDLEN